MPIAFLVLNASTRLHTSKRTTSICLAHGGHSSKLMTNTKLFSVLSLLAACLILFLIETISFVFDHFPIYCFSS